MDSILPLNSTQQEVALEIACREQFDIDVSDLFNLWHPELCPLKFLPFLAWAVSVDTWEDSWSESQKRAVVSESGEVHRRKGTIGAVRRAVSASWEAVEIQEWFAHGGDPYTFKALLLSEDEPFDFGIIPKAREVIMQTKNVRSRLESLAVRLRQKNECPRIGSALLSHSHVTIYPFSSSSETIEQQLYFASYISTLSRVTIFPQVS